MAPRSRLAQICVGVAWMLGLQVVTVQGSSLPLDVGSAESITSATKALTASVMAFYNGHQPGGIPGLLPPSAVGNYNWWESGAMWAQMIEYWYYTGDDQYNKWITQGLQFQVGPNNDFEPINQTRTEGNDDQAFWAFAAMNAAEMKFPDPPSTQPSWLSLAQAVFNRQAARWDMKHCGGGLRWQFNVLNNGYMDKNTISNGCFFQLSARLARYTGNSTYFEWAERAYDWMTNISPLITKNYEVYDSITFTDKDCNNGLGEIQWTYNIGTMIAGVAYMYNQTNGDEKWKKRLDGFLDNTQRVFFLPEHGGKTMIEYACETMNNCNKDQRSFKAYLSRWLTVSMQLAPYTVPRIKPWIETSAVAAAKACSQTANGLECGRTWYRGGDDGDRDVGQQLTAMSIVQSNLIWHARPLADIRVGTSKSDPTAGSTSGRAVGPDKALTRAIRTSDKAGAWILTILALSVGTIIMGLLLFEKKDISKYLTSLGGRSWR